MGCKVRSWGPHTNLIDQVIKVRCFRGDNMVDSAFSLNYDHVVTTDANRGARVWADIDNSTVGVGYQPAARWSFNSGRFIDELGTNTAFRRGDGQYTIVHSDQRGGDLSAVHVTAYGSSSEYCKVSSWTETAAGAIEVKTVCFGFDGVPINTRYVETYQTPRALE